MSREGVFMRLGEKIVVSVLVFVVVVALWFHFLGYRDAVSLFLLPVIVVFAVGFLVFGLSVFRVDRLLSLFALSFSVALVIMGLVVVYGVTGNIVLAYAAVLLSPFMFPHGLLVLHVVLCAVETFLKRVG